MRKTVNISIEDIKDSIVSAVLKQRHLTTLMFLYVSNPKFDGDFLLCKCPFHKGDDSRTMKIEVGPDLYECTECGVLGNRISFIARAEKCSELEAAVLFCTTFNLPIEVKSRTLFKRRSSEKKENPPK